jgi:hypothetical protein
MGLGPVKVAPSPDYKPVAKTGSIQFPHDLQGRLLELELAQSLSQFVHDMESRGYSLFNMPDNPRWSGEKGKALGYYAIDWNGEFKSTRDAKARRAEHANDPQYPVREAHDGPLPNRRESSLEDCDGMLEYRCVGVFWAPEVQIDVVTDSYLRKQNEVAARNPAVFGL